MSGSTTTPSPNHLLLGTGAVLRARVPDPCNAQHPGTLAQRNAQQSRNTSPEIGGIVGIERNTTRNTSAKEVLHWPNSADPPCNTFSTTPDAVAATENQCGQCLSWKFASRVDLGRGSRIWLCADCLQRHHRVEEAAW